MRSDMCETVPEDEVQRGINRCRSEQGRAMLEEHFTEYLDSGEYERPELVKLAILNLMHYSFNARIDFSIALEKALLEFSEETKIEGSDVGGG